ncbi:MAG: hypothetical protein RL417_1677 [Pseudomonadota bacterium]|jgi:hypothetical protein
MARKTEYGKYILSAGEVGAYTVCPESWRLRIVEQVKTVRDGASNDGQAAHKEWATTYEDVVYLGRKAHLLFVLLITAAVVYLIIQSR